MCNLSKLSNLHFLTAYTCWLRATKITFMDGLLYEGLVNPREKSHHQRCLLLSVGRGRHSGGAETHQGTHSSFVRPDNPGLLSSAECLIYSGHTARSGFGTPGKLWLLLWKLQSCVCTHHDEQQDVLEAIPEVQSVGAEKGKISLQELQTKQRGF